MKDALEALRRWVRAPSWLVLSIVLDVLFFVAYGFITRPIKDKILQHIVVISSLMSQAAQETGSRAVQTGQSIVAMLLTQPAIAPYVRQVSVLFVMLALASFVTFVLFQGVLWWIAHARSVKTMTLPEFIARFALLNVWWGIIAVVYNALSLLFDIRVAVIKSLSTVPSSDVPGIVLLVLAVFCAILAVWTYARPLKSSGWRGAVDGSAWALIRWKTTVPATVLVAVIFVAINYVIIGLSSQSATVALIVGGVLAIPAISWARVFLVLRGTHVD